LRWHLIRSVIAIGIGCIIVLIFAKDIVDGILLAPTRNNFIAAKWLCDLGHAIGIGDTICFPPIKAQFLENKMTGQFISYFTVGFMGGFVLAFPYIFGSFGNLFARLYLIKRKKNKGCYLLGYFIVFCRRCFWLFHPHSLYGQLLFQF
jgi:Sec-independent protein secretion pathway component TatC